MRRALAVVGGLMSCLACGEAAPPPSQPVAPGGFRLEASRSGVPAERHELHGGGIERLGLSLPEHLAVAWGVAPRDLDVRVELAAGDFDLQVVPLDGSRATAEAMVRGGLLEAFGVRVRSEVRDSDVFVLESARGGLRPEPVDPAAIAGGPVRELGRYRGAGAGIDDFARFLRGLGRRPVVDETGLAASYDIVLEWDPEAGGRALHAALRDAGFKLTPGRRSVTVWVVEPSP